MAFMAKDTSEGKQFELPSPGLHKAICVDVYDAGAVETPWGPKQKCMIVWEIDEVHPHFESPFRVNRRYTFSLNEKANLSKDLESWRGKAFTPYERKEGFDLDTIVGVGAHLNIIHNTDNQGRTWANVAAIMPLARAEWPKESGEYVRVRDRTDSQNGQNGQAQPQPQQQETYSNPAGSTAEWADDDLPF